MISEKVKSPVASKNIEAIYPLSPMQQGMLFHSLYAPESGVYVEQMTFTLKGDVNVAALESAWQKVVNRYSILRTLFIWENRPTPLQIVLKQVDLPWTNLNWLSLSPTVQQQQLSELLHTQRAQNFQFDRAPLMGCTLIQLTDDTHQLIWNSHHILSDGWCLPIIFNEVLSFYEAQVQGEICHLPTPTPYEDYIDWLNAQDRAASTEFWQQMLQGFSAPTPLVVGRTVPQSQQPDSNYRELELRLAVDVSHKLQALAQQHHVTLSTIIQAAWGLLLSRYSGEQDILFGVTVSGRPASLSGVEKMVGLFINTLPLRLQISPNQQLISWLEQIQQLMLELQQFSYTPLVEIQSLSEVVGGIPLFESIVVFENYPMDSSLNNTTGSLQVGKIESHEQTNFPLTVAAASGNELSVQISYDAVRFAEDTIERMLGHLQTIFSAIATNPHQTLGELPLLSESERQQLLFDWNDTAREYPQNKCIHQLFEEQVAKTPDAIAVVFEREELTYQQLNERANQLAHYLQTLGVKPEVLVGICVERSLEMVVGLLGILKAGGAYVPLDPSYPAERLSYMLSDAGVQVLLTQENLLSVLPLDFAQMVCLDKNWEAIEQHCQDNLMTDISADNLAYVIYTSGSTGQPKGVTVPHRGVNRLIVNTNYINLQEQDVVGLASNFSFDAITFEIWGALVHGAKLVGIERDVMLSPHQLANSIQSQKISTLFVTTALFNQITNVVPSAFNSLQNLMFGGEAVDVSAVQAVLKHQPPQRLLHVYGPTESTTFSTWYLVSDVLEEAKTIPIGRPIANTQTYILDRQMQPVPIGVAGELHIGGDGLARGYLNRPELTQAKFVTNPFSPQTSARLYKTGDLARYLPDGNIEFLGRIDHQVKIRGFRIELGEIEAVLSSHPQIQQTVVVATEDTHSNKCLISYVVSEDDDLSSQQLREFLQQRLPTYMVPSAFIILNSLPLTPNGKLDRKALPAPDGQLSHQGMVILPRDTTELKLAQIWSDVLNVNPIGVTNNFFELGGHSLLAVVLMSKIKQQFQRDLPLATLIQNPTIEQMAILLRFSTDSLAWSTLVPIKSNGNRPPLFCVHPGGGTVLCYQLLAYDLSPEQPLYGIQSFGINPQNEPHNSIEQMAFHYIQELKAVQPHGPYYLSGWSLGGLVAFEMAQQLVHQGEQIAFLGIIDSYPLSSISTEPEEDDAALLVDMFEDELDLCLEELRKLSPDDLLIYVLEQAKQKNIFPQDFDLAQARHFLMIFKLNVQALKIYKHQYYSGSIVLFKASDEKNIDLRSSWDLLAEQVETFMVSGEHHKMMEPPHVQELAQHLQKSLDKAQKHQLETSNA